MKRCRSRDALTTMEHGLGAFGTQPSTPLPSRPRPTLRARRRVSSSFNLSLPHFHSISHLKFLTHRPSQIKEVREGLQNVLQRMASIRWELQTLEETAARMRREIVDLGGELSEEEAAPAAPAAAPPPADEEKEM